MDPRLSRGSVIQMIIFRHGRPHPGLPLQTLLSPRFILFHLKSSRSLSRTFVREGARSDGLRLSSDRPGPASLGAPRPLLQLLLAAHAEDLSGSDVLFFFSFKIDLGRTRHGSGFIPEPGLGLRFSSAFPAAPWHLFPRPRVPPVPVESVEIGGHLNGEGQTLPSVLGARSQRAVSLPDPLRSGQTRPRALCCSCTVHARSHKHDRSCSSVLCAQMWPSGFTGWATIGRCGSNWNEVI